MPALYPIMLDLEGRTCVIVGGGKVAVRKVDSLLDTGAHIIVISLDLDWALTTLSDEHKLTIQRSRYMSGMLASLKPFLVFAATNDDTVNKQVVAEARSIGALANAVNAQGEHDFINLGTIQRGDITIAFSTGGASPALVAHLQREINKVIGQEYTTLLAWMAVARPNIQTGVKTQPERAALWNRILESSILDRLRQGDLASAKQLFDQLINEALDNRV